MLITFIMLAILGLLIILTIIFRYLYYLAYPTRTLDATIANTQLRNDITSGNTGSTGFTGFLNKFAVNGNNGLDGKIGEIGISGGKSLSVGSKGFKGLSGSQGFEGMPGVDGIPGLPSNSLVSNLTYNFNQYLDKNPIIIEHYFTFEDSVHKLTGSFLFDDVNYFSFQNGLDNSKFKIKTSDPLDNFLPAPLPGPTEFESRKIYSTIRIVLESKTRTSDGTIIYVSPPISRNGYLISSTVNYNNDNTHLFKLDEVTINENREFGLDFLTEKTLGTYYNFMVNGLFRYRSVFNIEPPISNLVPRLEERYSNELITDFNVPAIKYPAKGGLVKIKKAPEIYMLSPRLITGQVTYKNSADIKSVWKVLDVKTIEDSLDLSMNPLVIAFDKLEQDSNSFKDELEKAKSIQAISSSVPFIENPLTPLSEVYQNLFFRNKKEANFNDPDDGDIYSTTMIMNNLFINYSNTLSSLTYPSSLDNTNLYLKFIVKTNIKNLINQKYTLYDNTSKTYEISSSENLILSVNISTINMPGFIILDDTNQYIYHPITIKFENNINFNNIFGKKILLKFSNSNLNFDSKYGTINDYFTFFSPSHTRFDTPPHKTKTAFNAGSSEYDFQGAVIKGFDFYSEATKFEIAGDTFHVGYQKSITDIPIYQKVIGYKQKNGDYSLMIPPNGYIN